MVFVVTYRRLLKDGLHSARIDSLVGAAPLPPGMSGEDAPPPAPRSGFWAALRSRPRSRDGVARRRAA